MGQILPRWTPAGMRARALLLAASLTISAARGLGKLWVLTPGGATLAFQVASRLDRASMRNLARGENSPHPSPTGAVQKIDSAFVAAAVAMACSVSQGTVGIRAYTEF
jgi:hypothetical protein